MLRVYIAGKVTGEPPLECNQKFGKAELLLTSMGMQAINPLSFIPSDAEWHQAMKLCIRSLITCDFIYLLPDWKESEGAKLEAAIAEKLGIETINTI
ncbi:MAG: hypothetical protein BWY70_01813 [Bacteroidetes bacterium ADurb.Bin408]|nr:DUF4406 domain-containing protein [Bacteroidales bacterium]OPZ96245.1 MAG: hypothetical protein BWY70_01813 [Bacteroidetes bacterium ADurb.Bin408]HPI31109.1 DUF4406 domain-containing protein [Bacteroidales bacterium]